MVGREGLQLITYTTHTLPHLLPFNKDHGDREENSYKWCEELCEGGK